MYIYISKYVYETVFGIQQHVVSYQSDLRFPSPYSEVVSVAKRFTRSRPITPLPGRIWVLNVNMRANQANMKSVLHDVRNGNKYKNSMV